MASEMVSIRFMAGESEKQFLQAEYRIKQSIKSVSM
jgi:hypothetical protein